MSTPHFVKSAAPLPEVIVRAWGDEPVRLRAHGLNRAQTGVYVGQIDAERPICLSLEDVFDYNAERFNGLLDAYSQGDNERLKALYEEIKRRNKSSSPCNRYHKMLSSQHEKEAEIADSGSPADSGQQ